MRDLTSIYGQFFTKKDLCKKILTIVNNIENLKGNILEPSFGTGNFINELLEYKNINIDAIELDKKYFDLYKNNNIDLINIDFLNFISNKKYDFIIGNPPYIELCYSFYNKNEQEIIKQQYKDISNGRLNLVHIFLKKSIDLLNDDGIIAFLLPSAILTSPNYKKIRKIIYDNFNIEYLEEDVNFENVAIKVSLLIIRKTQNTNKYFYLNNDNYFIMSNYNKFKNIKTLKDYNFNVSIGNIVWNQHKDILTDDNNDNILIYSSNIDYDKLIFDNNRNRKQYIQNYNIKYSNCIIFPRTISKKIKFFFIKNNTKFIFENHVLIVSNNDLNLLEEFYNKLKNKEYDELLNCFFNSSNLTKEELLSLSF